MLDDFGHLFIEIEEVVVHATLAENLPGAILIFRQYLNVVSLVSTCNGDVTADGDIQNGYVFAGQQSLNSCKCAYIEGKCDPQGSSHSGLRRSVAVENLFARFSGRWVLDDAP